MEMRKIVYFVRKNGNKKKGGKGVEVGRTRGI